jgi:SSS family solute:Na+ symporter
VAAAIVLIYITLGGLSSAIYNEVLQFFIILAALVPLALVGLHDVGDWEGLKDAVRGSESGGEPLLHAWEGTGVGNVTNPLEASWVPIVFGLGFVLSFGYWTTNFAEVQRALSAKSLGAAQRTPLIGAYPKIFIPFITVIGMFWKRMTPWAGFWGLVAGTAGAAAAHYGNKWACSTSAPRRRPRSGGR